MKNIRLSTVAGVIICTLLSVVTRAQLTNCNVFLKGNYVEVGINTNGAFGSSVAAPAGYHPRGGVNMQNTCDNSCSGFSTLGFVADAAKDGWTVGNPAYYGDFFMPGSPQEGWSLEVDGVQSNAWNGNNAKCDSFGQFTGTLTGNNVSCNNSARVRSGTWQGHNGDSIYITQVTTLDTSNLFFTITVTLKNNANTTKNNIYYMRTVDPDNDQTLSGLFRTVNSVAYQLPNQNNRTLVTATGSLFTQAYLGLGTLDCRAKCFILGTGVKPSINCHSLYAGAQNILYSGGNTGDVGLGLVFSLGNLAPGDSVTLSYAYVLNASYLDIAFPISAPRFSATSDTATSRPSGDTAHVCQTSTITANVVNGSNFNWSWTAMTGDTISNTSGFSTGINMHGSVVVLRAVGTPICTGPMDTVMMIINPDRPLPSTPVASSNSPLCVGNNLNLSATSTAGASFSWIGPGGYTSANQNPSINNVVASVAGTYSVSATLNGCNSLASGTAAVVVNSNPTVSSISGTSAVCVNSTTTFSDATSGGVWSSSASGVASIGSSGIITGVSGGTATITYTVTNGSGCSVFATKQITVNAIPAVSAVIGTDSTCIGFSSTLSCSTPGGTWTSSDPTIVQIDPNTGVYTGISAGTANVTYTITDGFGCMGSSSVSALINPVYTITTLPVTGGIITPSGDVIACSADPVVFTFTPNAGYHIADITIDGVSYGSMTSFTFSSVNAPHNIGVSFQLDCTPPAITVCPGNINQSADAGVCNAVVSYSAATVSGTSPAITYSQNTGTSFPVGTTTVTVNATNDCGSDNCSFNVTVTDNQLPSISAPAAVTVNADAGVCLAASVSLGTPTTSDNCGVASVTNNASAPFVVGTTVVTWTVTDIHGNVATANQNVTVVDNQDPTITAPANVTVTANAGSCSATGVSLGTPTVADNCDIGSTTNNAPSSFPVGTTTVTWTVNDIHGHSATATQLVTVNANTLSVSATHTDASCHGGTNGSISTTVSGGTGSYSYTWSGGASGANPTGLAAGTYSLSVTDNGCAGATAATASVTVSEPAALTVSATGASVSCNSANGGTHNNGSISTTVSGGTGSYSYSWTGGASGANPSGLTAGTYTVTVTDGHSCTATASASVGQPSALGVTSSVTDVSCNSANGGTHNNGSISTTVTGGTSGYSYSWTGGASGANPGNLSAGTYSVTVTDAHSCTTAASATVGQPSALSVSTSATGVSCGGSNDGSITTTVTGGTSSYSYSWTGGATGANPTGLAAGTYSVTVTDAHSCTTSGSATVNQSGNANSTISGSSTVLGGTTNTYTGPSGMSTYTWTISGGDHVCDSKCHHNNGHTCGSGCDHYGHACTNACHHYNGHSCTNNHTGDHHCNIYCHHNSGHSCGIGCDHYGQSCTSACHHNSNHKCSHQHCGSATISGSNTGSSVSVVTPCCASTYTLTLTTTNNGGCTSTSTMPVTVNASATITVYSTLYTTGSGNHPGVTKSGLAANLKVYDRHTVGARDANQNHYSNIWNSATGLVSNVTVSAPETVTLGGGPAYRYTITVPAYGHYLVLGQSTVASNRCGGTTCTVYTGKKVGGHEDCDGNLHLFDDDDDDDITPCSSTTVRFHSIIKDQTGKCTESDTHQEHGSLMLTISPMALEFVDSVSYLPVVYESVEGDWDVTVTADPPYGFYTDPGDALSTNVTDSVMNAVQFAVIDTGSEWTFTNLTHKIQHKGAERTAYSRPAMVNKRTNKPSQINVIPNPADDQIKIIMPNFEGKATLYVYNLLGQKVAEQPINIISGASVSMDISSLVPGVYLITAENTSGKATSRLVKKAK